MTWKRFTHLWLLVRGIGDRRISWMFSWLFVWTSYRINSRVVANSMRHEAHCNGDINVILLAADNVKCSWSLWHVGIYIFCDSNSTIIASVKAYPVVYGVWFHVFQAYTNNGSHFSADERKTQMGPVSLTIFARYSNWMETLPSCNYIVGHQTATNFCECHDSIAVVSCTKFCSDRCVKITGICFISGYFYAVHFKTS